MKLSSTLIILIALLHLQLTEKVHAQGITLSVKNARIQTVFEEIRKQSNYTFVFSREQLAGAKPVTVQVVNATINKVLELIFKGQPITYNIVDNKYVVIARPKNPAGPASVPANEKDRGPSEPIDISGKVINEKGEPVAGATVSVEGSTSVTSTNGEGMFSLTKVNDKAILVITNVGYERKVIRLNRQTTVTVALRTMATELREVVVNTGYQQIPKERSTGSFEFINQEQLNKRVGPDILSRIEGVSSGVLIDRRQSNAASNTVDASKIIIRGLSTIGSDRSPLIVVNNLPYDGDINNINPNDVETITILKDAAAASIWGAKAGNGVIVITTRKGKLNQSLKVSLSTNFNIVEKPDLFYYPQMSSADFIDVEVLLFSKGFYNGMLNHPIRPSVSPVVEILNRRRLGQIDAKDSMAQIDQLKQLDVRNDFSKYIYRTAVNQQYFLNLSGGTDKIRYTFSGGFDKNPASLVGNDVDRITLRTDNTLNVFKGFDLNLGLNYSRRTMDNNSLGDIGTSAYNYNTSFRAQRLYPYARFAGPGGDYLPIAKDYRKAYTDTAGSGKLLNWDYKVLEELQLTDNKTKAQDITLNLNATWKLTDWLTASVNYQYEQTNLQQTAQSDIRSYYVRNLINLFTEIGESSITNYIPKGGIVDESVSDLRSQSARAQVSVNKTIQAIHEISGIAGVEVREKSTDFTAKRLYGFNQSNYTFGSVDYTKEFPLYGNRGVSMIPNADYYNKLMDRFVSLFANMSYTYDNRYSLTGSVRRDASNLFGVDIKNKWKPLWSAGVSWNISNESFYNLGFLPMLRLRTTYGYQGNVNNNISPYTLLTFQQAQYNLINEPYAEIIQPANPDLSWETISQFNIGIDFGLAGNKITGAIDVFRKRSSNLIYMSEVDPTTGLVAVSSNSATLSGRGIDLRLNTRNFDQGFKWYSTLLFSYVSNKVLDYKYNSPPGTVGDLVNQAGLSPDALKGKSPYGLYSLPFAGLDPQTGDPRGYLGKEISTDYSEILNQRLDTSLLIYHGSSIPRYFGFLDNVFRYRDLILTVNIAFKFDYFFRKQTIHYYNLFTRGFTHGDYAKRWRQPGDETSTSIPSLRYPSSNPQRDEFYAGSSVNVLKGDHIRLQYIKLAYSIGKEKFRKLPVNNVEFYLNINNLGILWRANKERIDPEFELGQSYFPPSRQYAIGLNIQFN